MKYDPFTLRVALSNAGGAYGELYLDDGVTFSHRNGEFIWREFKAEKKDKKDKGVRISSRDLASRKPREAVDGAALATYDGSNAFVKDMAAVRIERVVIFGLASKPTSVKVEGGKELEWDFTPGIAASDKKENMSSLLVVKDPGVSITSDWDIIVQV